METLNIISLVAKIEKSVKENTFAQLKYSKNWEFGDSSHTYGVQVKPLDFNEFDDFSGGATGSVTCYSEGSNYFTDGTMKQVSSKEISSWEAGQASGSTENNKISVENATVILEKFGYSNTFCTSFSDIIKIYVIENELPKFRKLVEKWISETKKEFETAEKNKAKEFFNNQLNQALQFADIAIINQLFGIVKVVDIVKVAEFFSVLELKRKPFQATQWAEIKQITETPIGCRYLSETVAVLNLKWFFLSSEERENLKIKRTIVKKEKEEVEEKYYFIKTA